VLAGDEIGPVMKRWGGEPPGATLRPDAAAVLLLDAALAKGAQVPATLTRDFSLLRVRGRRSGAERPRQWVAVGPAVGAGDQYSRTSRVDGWGRGQSPSDLGR
jgi:hypothetical protein